MCSKSLIRTARMFVLSFLISGTFALAQTPQHFSGTINDFSPSTVKAGPYVMAGHWALDLHDGSTLGDFSAMFNMETSDYGITEGIVDPTDPSTRSAHTHHIRVKNAVVTWNMDGCPAFNPATAAGFQVNGTVSLLTGNGSNAPFETDPPSSTVQVCVTGGSGDASIPYSNMSLVFQGPATAHFGTAAVHGVVSTRK